MPIQVPSQEDLLALDNRISALEKAVIENSTAVEFNRQKILSILNVPAPAVREGIEISPEDDLQQAINDAGGEKIWLKDGIYPPIKVRIGTRIEAINKHKTIIQGTEDWSDGWESRSGVWFKPLSYTFHQHPANSVHEEKGQPSARGLSHRKAMQPHMLVWDNTVMHPVYDLDDLTDGAFYLEGTSSNPIGIWARFPGNRAPSEGSIQLGNSQYLVKGATADVDGVELTGLLLRYCANTGTQGALHMEQEMDNWVVRDCDILWSMAEGGRLKGTNHLFERCQFNHHGHVGMALQSLSNSQFIDCESSHNVWLRGIDPMWHSGGIKAQYGVNNNIFLRHKSANNDGPGIWEDIYNTGNVFDYFLIEDNVGAGLFTEHHTTSTTATNGVIRGTRKIYGVGSGLLIQGAVENCIYQNIKITDNADGAIYYKKREGRGPSGHNTFENIEYSGNGNDNRIAVQGDINDMPDNWGNLDTSTFRNWP